MYLVTFIQEAQYGEDSVTFRCDGLDEVDWIAKYLPNANIFSKTRVEIRPYDPKDELERKLDSLNDSLEESLKEAQEDIDSEAMSEEAW